MDREEGEEKERGGENGKLVKREYVQLGGGMQEKRERENKEIMRRQ